MHLPEMLVKVKPAQKGPHCEPELSPTMAVVWGRLL